MTMAVVSKRALTGVCMAGAAGVLVAVKVGLHIAPMWTIRAARGAPGPSRAHAVALVTHLGRVVSALGRIPLLRSTCLSRSIAVLVLARCAGVTPTLVIGARRLDTALDAHAWLECDGVHTPAEQAGGHVRLWSAS